MTFCPHCKAYIPQSTVSICPVCKKNMGVFGIVDEGVGDLFDMFGIKR